MRFTSIILTAFLAAVAAAEEFKPAQTMPEDAIVLFDGKGVCQFADNDGKPANENWKVEDGCLISGKSGKDSNHIHSTVTFQDAEIHVEFCTPENSAGNSGVYIHGRYEMQIFNSANKENPDKYDCGALYNKYAPLVQACKPAGEWQVYDIKFTAPRRDESGKIVTPGRITAYLNGQLVQNDVTFEEPWSVYRPEIRPKSEAVEEVNRVMKETGEGALFLQDHSAPVKFRNVWIRKTN